MDSGSERGYCILCKDIVHGRYMIEVRDSVNGVGVKDHVCRSCFNRFLSSHSNEGVFRLSKLMGWMRYRDRIRD